MASISEPSTRSPESASRPRNRGYPLDVPYERSGGAAGGNAGAETRKT